MSSSDYIIKKLEEVSKAITTIRFSYAFDHQSSLHIVEVYPRYTFDYNDDYIEFEDELTLEIAESYPEENILFVSEGDPISIDNSMKLIIGKDYLRNSFATSFNPILSNDFTFVIDNLKNERWFNKEIQSSGYEQYFLTGSGESFDSSDDYLMAA